MLQLAERTSSTQADLLWLARLCACDERLRDVSELTDAESGEVIGILRQYYQYDQLACVGDISAV